MKKSATYSPENTVVLNDQTPQKMSLTEGPSLLKESYILLQHCSVSRVG